MIFFLNLNFYINYYFLNITFSLYLRFVNTLQNNLQIIKNFFFFKTILVKHLKIDLLYRMSFHLIFRISLEKCNHEKNRFTRMT